MMGNPRKYILQLGDNSHLVKILKQILVTDLKSTNNLSQDFSFNQETQNAVINYQIKKNLSPTGIMDIKTWRAMGKDMNNSKYGILTRGNAELQFLLNKKRWTTEVHNEITKRSYYGLSEQQIQKVLDGNYSVDVSHVIYPRTLLPSEANKHAMAKPGQSREDAVKGANYYVHKMLDEALEEQGKYLRKNLQGLSLSALYLLGQAIHTIQDAYSPVHGFAEYTIPQRKYIEPKSGYEASGPDWDKYVAEMLEHKKQENTMPSEEYLKEAYIKIRQAFRYVFGTAEFEKCVSKKIDQDLVYAIYPKK